MIEDVRNAVDWDSLRVEVFCSSPHSNPIKHPAEYYVRRKCAYCDYAAISTVCQQTVAVLMRTSITKLRVTCPACGERTPAGHFYSVVGKVNE